MSRHTKARKIHLSLPGRSSFISIYFAEAALWTITLYIVFYILILILLTLSASDDTSENAALGFGQAIIMGITLAFVYVIMVAILSEKLKGSFRDNGPKNDWIVPGSSFDIKPRLASRKRKPRR